MINWLVFFPDQTRFEKAILYSFSSLSSVLSLGCGAYLLITKSDCSNTNLGVAIRITILHVAFSNIKYSSDYPVLLIRHLCPQHQALCWAWEEDIWLYPVYFDVATFGSLYHSSYLVHHRLCDVSFYSKRCYRYRIRSSLLLIHLCFGSCGSIRLPL